jgi:hypothetical protein
VLTDISSVVGGYAEPDDTQSLVRLLLYTNELELEGLVATYTNHGHTIHPQCIRMILQAYGKVHPRLVEHDPRYPSRETLLGMLRCGSPRDGPEQVGDGKDTEGSEWIIACADREDERPLWILVWGGITDLAQALWKVRHTRGEAGYESFKSKLRVYAISDQYAMGSMVRDQNPDLFYIVSGDSCRGMYREGDTSLAAGAWLDTHVRAFHGTLGAAYPMYDGGDPWGRVVGMKEGDTPSLLYLVANGLGEPEHPEWGSWGGRFRRAAGRCYVDAEDTVDGQARSARAAVYRWRDAYQRDFQARMDWCVRSRGECNHAPVAVAAAETAAGAGLHPGDTVRLNAAGSYDPDGDELSFHWEVYREAGTYEGEVEIRGGAAPVAELQLPPDSGGCTIHVLLSLTDKGEPPLTSYRRIVLQVNG